MEGRVARMRPEQLPRVFQCNLDRLFQRVVMQGLDVHPIHAELQFGQAETLDEFLDRSAAQVDNYMANEAAKAYALTLAAVFERQLHTFMRHLWAKDLVPEPARPKSGKARRLNYGDLLRQSAAYANIDLDGLSLAYHLDELLLVANVVRHGEGDSCNLLQAHNPRLWIYARSAYVDLLPGPADLSETMRILREDLIRYVTAAILFWGHADTLPMASREAPAYAILRPSQAITDHP